MSKSTRYSPEVSDRAMQMVSEHQGESESRWAAIVSIGAKIGCTAETRRRWLHQTERAQWLDQALRTDEHERLKAEELRREAELSVRKLSDYDMLCCMIDENLTQQHIEPKTVFEIVAAAIKEAEKMLRATKNVYDFNAHFKNSRGIPSLLQENKSVRPVPDERNSFAPEEYTRAKLAIEPSGNGLGKDFLRHFLPPHSVASNSTLQTAIAAYYQEKWRNEGDRLSEESHRLLWKGQEENDQEKILAALELEKQARVLLGKALWLPGYCAAAPQFKSCHPLAR